MQYSIHLVEDEQALNNVLKAYLTKEGWKVTSFLNGEEALAAIDKKPHLWVLDIMLPDIDGFQLLKEIKKTNPDMPVILISARDAELDRVIGLEMGSDDYIAKPFMPRELIIRIKNLLQRVYTKSETEVKIHLCGEYVIDESKRSVTYNDHVLDLTAKEFDLLLLFCLNKGQAFSRESVLLHVWGEHYYGSDRVVDDLIRRLRKKMPHIQLQTIYGFGYRMSE
jgi:two-component system, OmpR family, response regulator CssR